MLKYKQVDSWYNKTKEHKLTVIWFTDSMEILALYKKLQLNYISIGELSFFGGLPYN